MASIFHCVACMCFHALNDWNVDFDWTPMGVLSMLLETDQSKKESSYEELKSL